MAKKQPQYIVYGFFDKEGDIIYIGMAEGDGTVRRQNHLKPSKIDIQPINRFIQDNIEGEDWSYEVLDTIDHWFLDNKMLAHLFETEYIKRADKTKLMNKYKVR